MAKRVLLVDDDEGTRVSLGIALAGEGCRVASAGSGQEALALLAREPFDWLVTDRQMLPMDGYALAAAARHLQPQLRVAMISGLPLHAPVSTAVEQVFAKPVDAGILARFLTA